MHVEVRLSACVYSPCRLAGNRSPGALARADTLFNGVLHRVQKQVYEVYGAVELMVSDKQLFRGLTTDCRASSTV